MNRTSGVTIAQLTILEQPMMNKMEAVTEHSRAESWKESAVWYISLKGLSRVEKALSYLKIVESFDTRQQWKVKHKLSEIIGISFFAMIANATIRKR